MLIQNAINKILFGTLIIFMSVPFCFAQGTIPSKEGLQSQTLVSNDESFPRKRESHFQLHEFNSTFSFFSLVKSEEEFYSPFQKPVPNLLREGEGFYSPLKRGEGGILFLDCINCIDATDSLRPDSTLRKPIDKKFRMKKSPWVAVGLSALLPGAGQFYNKSYWKVPVVLGLVGYFAYEFYDNDKQYRDYRDRYSATQTPENPAGDENLKTLRQFYFNQRNDFVWYFTIVYVINLIDAYVDAHLFDFDVREEKLTRFGTTDKEYRLNVKVKF
jgi:hypothetical protein